MIIIFKNEVVRYFRDCSKIDNGSERHLTDFERIKAAFSAVAADCMDGNNGGCSHYCNMNGGAVECTCPPCWSLDADNNCAPAQEFMQVSCSASEMFVELHSCIYQDEVDLVWGGENSCDIANLNVDLYEDAQVYEISTALDDCSVNATATDGVIVFSNSGSS